MYGLTNNVGRKGLLKKSELEVVMTLAKERIKELEYLASSAQDVATIKELKWMVRRFNSMQTKKDNF